MKLNKKGFTLIELLAVIVILGVILLLAIPSVSRIIRDSQEKSFFRQVETLIDGAKMQAMTDDNYNDSENFCIVLTSIDLEKGNLSSPLKNGSDMTGYILIEAGVAKAYISDGTNSVTNYTHGGTSALDATYTSYSNTCPATGYTLIN